MKIGNLEVHNTAQLVGPGVRLCACMWAAPKFGKTRWAAQLDKITKKYYNKKTLFIAVEAADGGGTMSIRDLGVDYVEPRSWSEFQGIVAALQTDTTYGGVVVDNATDLVKRYIQPEALKMPLAGALPNRAKGVPDQKDYQAMGEMLRTELNKLVNLTKQATPEDVRKHLIMTALEYVKTSRDGQQILRIGPTLPGQMSDTASAMFQTMLTLEVEARVVQSQTKPGTTERINERMVVSEADGVKILGDRMGIFPRRGTFDLMEVWEKYWIPATSIQAEAVGG